MGRYVESDTSQKTCQDPLIIHSFRVKSMECKVSAFSRQFIFQLYYIFPKAHSINLISSVMEGKKLLTVMSKKNFVLFILAVSGSSILSAQTKNDSTFRQLDQVVVTATRYPVKESQTGKVVMFITHGALAKSTGKPLGLLLTDQDAITVAAPPNTTATHT